MDLNQLLKQHSAAIAVLVGTVVLMCYSALNQGLIQILRQLEQIESKMNNADRIEEVIRGLGNEPEEIRSALLFHYDCGDPETIAQVLARMDKHVTRSRPAVTDTGNSDEMREEDTDEMLEGDPSR